MYGYAYIAYMYVQVGCVAICVYMHMCVFIKWTRSGQANASGGHGAGGRAGKQHAESGLWIFNQQINPNMYVCKCLYVHIHMYS